MLRSQHRKFEKAVQLLNDGIRSDGDALQRLTPQAPPLMTAQDIVEAALEKSWIPIVEVPLQLHAFPRTPKFIFVDAGSGFGFGGLEATTAGQVVYEDLMTIKAKASSLKRAQKRKTITSTPTITISPLNMPQGNGSGLTSPSREGP